ncbi:MAG: lamin tail domain-containing protein, partial [Bacteroidota bacterium]
MKPWKLLGPKGLIYCMCAICLFLSNSSPSFSSNVAGSTPKPTTLTEKESAAVAIFSTDLSEDISVSSPVFGPATTSTLTLASWTPSASFPDGYIVFINDAPTGFSPPPLFASPSVSTTWSGVGPQAIYSGAASNPNVTVTGLDIGTTYYFVIYSGRRVPPFNALQYDTGVGTNTSTLPPNSAPSFDLISDPHQTVANNIGAFSVTGFAQNITDNDGGTQALIFDVEVPLGQQSLFSSLPTIDAASGDLAFSPAPGTYGLAEVSVTLRDNGGTDGLGVDESAPQTFDIFVVPPGLVINELDANTDGTDDREFIELYNADGADLSLDEFVLVFFNGNSPTDASYRTVDLSGTLSAGGYLVIGNSEVDNVSSFTFASNQLQNGGDAVAVYLGDAVNFPNGNPPDGNGLVDALVYDADGDGFDDALR